jgi:dTDP-4-amino-4,6-dideoxygalactose transaminase
MASRPYHIRFNVPGVTGKESEYVADAVRRGHLSGDGHYSKACQAVLEQALGAPKVLLTTSCTHALEMAALLLDLRPGDEVIVPSFTFVSTVNAFVLRGARPVFIDIRPDTLNLDERLLEGLVSSRTRAVVPVHYAGVGCEMETVNRVAAERGFAVVEDNAHGLFGKYRDRPLGSWGCLATQSFHETKNFNCGEGGALVINDPALMERAEILREKGTDRSRFFRGQVDKYTWVDLGSSYLPSDILAAFLLAQLEARDEIQSARARLWNRYHAELRSWAGDFGIGLPQVPDGCEQSHHMFYLLLPTLRDRQALITHLRERGIQAVFHYVPLHLSEMGRKLGGDTAACPVTEEVSDRLLRLPFYNSLSESDQAEVIAAVSEFRPE